MNTSVDFRNFEIHDVRECLERGGYLTTDEEFNYADKQGLFKYLGARNKQAHYLVGFKDEDSYFTTIVHVYIGPTGTIVGSYEPQPTRECESEQELVEYFHKRASRVCN